FELCDRQTLFGRIPANLVDIDATQRILEARRIVHQQVVHGGDAGLDADLVCIGEDGNAIDFAAQDLLRDPAAGGIALGQDFAGFLAHAFELLIHLPGNVALLDAPPLDLYEAAAHYPLEGIGE